MELLKDLGTRTTVTSSGKKNTRRWGLYRCPVCEEGIERSSIKGSKNNTCGKAGCRSKGSTEYGSWNKGMKSSEKTINKPYYSTIGDYYRKLDKNNICESWQTLSGFMYDMYDDFVKLRTSGIHSLTLSTSSTGMLDSTNCTWVEDLISNLDFTANAKEGLFSARMLAQELNIKPYIVTKTLRKMPIDFGVYNHELIKVTPSKSIRTYSLSEYQYNRLKDRIKDNIRRKSSNVYLVHGNGLTKIGIAVEVEKRLITLKGSSPVPVKLIASFKVGNALYIEKQLHKKYEEYNSHGEWFKLSKDQVKEIIDYLDNL